MDFSIVLLCVDPGRIFRLDGSLSNVLRLTREATRDRTQNIRKYNEEIA